MNTNVVEAPVQTVVPPMLARMDRAQQMRLGIGLIALIAVVVAAFLMSRQPDWRVLFNGLSDKDGGAIVAQLAQMNVPYKYSEGGGAIMVPAEKVHDTRLRLASQGLPKGSVAGFEMMETNRFGMTQFQERLTFQRGLEGELTRSIQALSSVQSARVHLALPNQNGFFREQQKPSASVLLTLHRGRTLDRNQVAGIVHLVASSVPELDPKAISVIDDAGALLSNSPDAQGTADLQQLQYTQNLEQTFSRRIMELLEPVVGRSNVKAQVAAEVDFSQSESTFEQHKPNQTSEAAAIRSQQVVESSNGGAAGSAGVPGAASNQPPGPTSAPINAPPAGTGSAQAAGPNSQSRRESVTNYEVDKTVRVVKASAGAVKRMSAAVVVNHRSITDASGKTVTKPLTDDEMAKINALVREAIGFNKERGDSVNVMNSPFVTEARTVVDVPWWQRAETQDLARTVAWPAGMLLLGLLVTFGLVRPAIKQAMRPPVVIQQQAEPGLDALVSEAPERPPLLTAETDSTTPPPTPQQLRLEDAKSLARSNPVAVANIVKTWVNGEAPA